MPVLDFRSLSEAVQDSPAPEADKTPALVERTVTFTVDYTVPNTGKKLSGSFVGTVVGRDERVTEGRIKALLAGRFRYDDMPEDWRLWADAIAYCEVRLKQKPAWFSEHAETDNRLLNAVFGRLLEHEQAFFRTDVSESEEATEQPVVVIR